MYIPCSLLTASVHNLQLAHRQCTYFAARSLPMYIYLAVRSCQCKYLAARLLRMYIPCSSLTASVHTLQLAHCQCTYLAARSLPVYTPCSSLSHCGSVHTLQLAHYQCIYLAARSVTTAVYIPCSSLTASVHTLHVNKKYTRRPHERSTVQFICHVDLVFRTSTQNQP